MQTNIDDVLLAEAMEATGQTSAEAAVEAALRRVVQLHRQKIAGEALAGIGWDGDLESIRHGRES